MPASSVEPTAPSINMRTDLDQSLEESYINPASLSPFQRIILTTDGTLTEILEAYLFEPLQVVKLSEHVIELSSAHSEMKLEPGRRVIDRKIFLQGKISMRNFIYAESMVALERLEPTFQHELLESKVPMGKLWRQNRLETYKEIISTKKEPAQGLAKFFDIEEQDQILSRTYLVFSKQQPIIQITEKFPVSYFLNKL
jgi:chorismate-pyruvate lyase